MNLDDARRFREVDAADVLGDIEATADQWRDARKAAGPPLDLDDVRAVLVTGMGGSGLTGDLIAALAADDLDLPVFVHKGYGLPRWARKQLLLIAVSYSGDTEETVSAVGEAIARGCPILAISSGGELDRLAGERGLGRVTVAAGGMPRHSLGKLAVPALVALGLDGGLTEAIRVQAELATAFGRGVPTAANPAKQLALAIARGGLAVACGASGLSALAACRLKAQLNENAKLPAFASVLPELCHNEVVGWEVETVLTRAAGLVCFRDPSGEPPPLARRIEATVGLVSERVGWSTQVAAWGRSPLARAVSLLLFADLVSAYAAIALDRDPAPIASIERLKRELAEAAVSGQPVGVAGE